MDRQFTRKVQKIFLPKILVPFQITSNADLSGRFSYFLGFDSSRALESFWKSILSVHPKDYEVTNHFKKGRCISCSDSLDRFHSDSSGKILFGDKTKREEIPWHVSIHYHDNSFRGCGGTLISPSKILSAAHCFGKNPQITTELLSGRTYTYNAIVGNTKVDFQIDH